MGKDYNANLDGWKDGVLVGVRAVLAELTVGDLETFLSLEGEAREMWHEDFTNRLVDRVEKLRPERFKS